MSHSLSLAAQLRWKLSVRKGSEQSSNAEPSTAQIQITNHESGGTGREASSHQRVNISVAIVIDSDGEDVSEWRGASLLGGLLPISTAVAEVPRHARHHRHKVQSTRTKKPQKELMTSGRGVRGCGRGHHLRRELLRATTQVLHVDGWNLSDETICFDETAVVRYAALRLAQNLHRRQRGKSSACIPRSACLDTTRLTSNASLMDINSSLDAPLSTALLLDCAVSGWCDFATARRRALLRANMAVISQVLHHLHFKYALRMSSAEASTGKPRTSYRVGM